MEKLEGMPAAPTPDGSKSLRDDCEGNIEVVRRLFAAVESRGDPSDFAARWAAYEAMYDRDVVIHEAPSLPYDGDYAGDGALARHTQGFNCARDSLQKKEADLSLRPRFLAEGDHVVVLWRQQGQAPDGERFDMPAVSVYRMKDGRVVDSRMFHFDAAAVREFLDHARTTAN